jgi:hypothetical protein
LLGCLIPAEPRVGSAASGSQSSRWKVHAVKKLLVLVLLGVGIFAVWRKVQADRAEIDLWTEATTGEVN